MLTHDEQTLTVESRTVEEALASISERLGPDVEIVGAQKVVRGGVGGFFARELVQISARPAGASEPQGADTPAEFADVLRRRLDPETASVEIELPADGDDVRVVLRNGAAAGEEEANVVAAMLAGPPPPAALPTEPPPAAMPEPPPTALLVAPPPPAALPSEPPPPAMLVEPPPPAAMPTEPPPAVMPPAAPAASVPQAPALAVAGRVPTGPTDRTGPGWTLEALLAMRLPAAIIRACAGLDPEADLEWVSAIAAACAPLCQPLAADPAVVAGPGAHHLAGPLRLPAVRAGEPVPADGSFCATVHDSDDDRAWLQSVLGSRRLHVVLGEQDWEGLLVEPPMAVSWTGDRALPGALYLAAALGVPLGFGATGGFPVEVALVDPVDVGLAIRRLVRG